MGDIGRLRPDADSRRSPRPIPSTSASGSSATSAASSACGSVINNRSLSKVRCVLPALGRVRWLAPLAANRAGKPPTSSSLADEKRVGSFLLSTPARDSRRRKCAGTAAPCRSVLADMPRSRGPDIQLRSALGGHRAAPAGQVALRSLISSEIPDSARSVRAGRWFPRHRPSTPGQQDQPSRTPHRLKTGQATSVSMGRVPRVGGQLTKELMTGLPKVPRHLERQPSLWAEQP